MTRRTYYAVAQANLIVPQGRAGIWKLMLKADKVGPWTRRDIEFATCGPGGAVTTYLSYLKRGGYVVEVGSEPNKNGADRKFYRLAKKPLHAPRLAADGSELAEPLVDTIWRTMKMLKTFTPTEVAQHATSPERTVRIKRVRVYMTELLKAGVVKRIKPKGLGTDGTYQLIKDIGPFAPMLLAARFVYDPNADAVLFDAKAREVPL